MSKIKPRAKIPKEAELDEVIEIKTLIRHPMHSGRVKDANGKTIPRLIINKFNGITFKNEDAYDLSRKILQMKNTSQTFNSSAIIEDVKTTI